MSVIATPVKQTEAVRSADAVYLVDINTGLPGGGSLTDAELRATPVFVQMNRGTFTMSADALSATTPKTIFPLDANRIAVRVLNFGAAPVFVTVGTTGTPNTGPGSDFIPAAVGTVPGEWEPPYACGSGVRAYSASAAGLTLMSW